MQEVKENTLLQLLYSGSQLEIYQDCLRLSLSNRLMFTLQTSTGYNYLTVKVSDGSDLSEKGVSYFHVKIDSSEVFDFSRLVDYSSSLNIAKEDGGTSAKIIGIDCQFYTLSEGNDQPIRIKFELEGGRELKIMVGDSPDEIIVEIPI